MTFARAGTVRIPVVGLIEDNDAQALGTGYLISLASYRAWFTERVDASGREPCRRVVKVALTSSKCKGNLDTADPGLGPEA